MTTQAQIRSERQIARFVKRANISQAFGPPSLPEWEWTRDSRTGLRPKTALWLAIAAEEATKARLPISAVVGWSKKDAAVLARWKAWRRILDSDSRISVLSLAKVCGFDHTSILYAMRRLAGESARDFHDGYVRYQKYRKRRAPVDNIVQP